MNPHFIYNALNSIQALVFSDKPEEASLYISKFGRLLRQVLNHSEQPLIPLQEELEALELYIQLEQVAPARGFLQWQHPFRGRHRRRRKSWCRRWCCNPLPKTLYGMA